MALDVPTAPRQAPLMASGQGAASTPFTAPSAPPKVGGTMETGARVGAVAKSGKVLATGGNLSSGKDMGGTSVPATNFLG